MSALIVGPQHGTLNLSPIDPNLSILLNSGAFAFWDPDWEDGLALRQSGEDFYVTAMMDRINGHVVTQGTEASQPLWGAPTSTGRRRLVGPAWLRSVESAATWSFLHDGTGCELLSCVEVHSGAAGGGVRFCVVSTQSPSASSRGASVQLQSHQHPRVDVGNGSSIVINNLIALNAAVGKPSGILGYRYAASDDPDATVSWSDVSVSANAENPPNSSAPANSFTIGAFGNGSGPVDATIGGVIVFARVLSSGERASVKAALSAYYGVAA